MRVSERGPVRARARITATYVWPDHVDGSSQERVGEQRVAVDTDVELRADDPVVRVTTSFVNPSGDHRLRVHLPLPEPARQSHAESPFTIVTRGLTAEGRSDEFGLPTAPSNRFVTAGRLTVAHEGVCEYELVDIEGDAARTLALTVLRSTGMLSRLGMTYRPFPAGPLTPVEGLQMRGKQVELRYALALDCDDPYGTGRRRAATARDRAQPGRRDAPVVGQRAGGARRRGQCAPPRRRRARGPRLQSRARSPRWSRSRGAPAGSSTSAATRRSRSRAPSSYGPSASPRPGCATTESGPRLASRRSPTPRSSSRSRRTSERRSHRTLRRRSAAAPVPSAS